jgi:endonuclease/exonuclease/phosphatase family metal-dependent hydrolase
METKTKSYRKPRGLHALVLLAHLSLVAVTLPSALAYYVSPEHWNALGFFALLAPFLALFQGVFLLYWATQLRRWALLSALVLAATFPQWRGQFHLRLEPTDGAPLWRLMTWNVHGWRNAAWTHEDSTANAMVSHALSADPFVLALQENREIAHAALSEHWPYSYREADGSGLAVYSKKPFGRKGYVPFNDPYPGHEGFLWADCALPAGDTVRIINVHLVTTTFVPERYESLEPQIEQDPSSQWVQEGSDIAQRLGRASARRAMQVSQIAAFAQKSPHPVIWCGDFNDTPSSFTYRTATQNASDAFLQAGRGFGNTYAKLALIPLRIDHVLVQAPWHAVGYAVWKQPFSDHHPVAVDFSTADTVR